MALAVWHPDLQTRDTKEVDGQMIDIEPMNYFGL
jgi:hypothetical protein